MVQLVVDGDVDVARSFDAAALADLPEQVDDVAALVPGKQGAGVRLGSVLAAAGARGAFVTLLAADGFSICVPRAAVERGVLAYRLGAGSLPEALGGPLRLLLVGGGECDGAGVDACANVKRLAAIRVSAERAADTHRH